MPAQNQGERFFLGASMPFDASFGCVATAAGCVFTFVAAALAPASSAAWTACQTAVRVATATWVGTIGFDTLDRCLRFAFKDQIGIKSVGGLSPYFFVISANENLQGVPWAIKDAIKGGIPKESLLGQKEARTYSETCRR